MARKKRQQRGEAGHADPNASPDEITDQLGGRTLGELGTTGGTMVGAEMQEATDNATIGGDHIAASHAYDPGMAGRTGGGNLGVDLTEETVPEREIAAEEDQELPPH